MSGRLACRVGRPSRRSGAADRSIVGPIEVHGEIFRHSIAQHIHNNWPASDNCLETALVGDDVCDMAQGGGCHDRRLHGAVLQEPVLQDDTVEAVDFVSEMARTASAVCPGVIIVHEDGSLAACSEELEGRVCGQPGDHTGSVQCRELFGAAGCEHCSGRQGDAREVRHALHIATMITRQARCPRARKSSTTRGPLARSSRCSTTKDKPAHPNWT